MDWYYAEGERQLGPVSEEQFQRLVDDAVVRGDTLVWCDGMRDWMPYAQAMAASGAATDSAACVQCSRLFPKIDMLAFRGQWICAECKPVFFQRIQENGEASSGLQYAELSKRAVAKIADAIILWMAGGIVFYVFALSEAPVESLALLSYAIGPILNISYITFFLGRFGATPGKMGVGIRVVRSDGAPITYGRAFARALAEYLSAFVFLIGYIIAAFDDQKRALHDHICDTRVVRK